MISIIVPIYNAESYLEECLKSIQKQDYLDFEVLCVNDGSLDRSVEIVENICKSDSRFVLINQVNGGVSKARNTALSKAKGDYICFVDSDDVISVDYLSTLLSLSADGSFSVCGYTRTLSDIDEIKTNDSCIYKYSAIEFIKSVFDETIEHPNIWMMLFKNSIIQMQHLDFTLGCARNEDTEFYVKYLLYEDKVAYTTKKCYYYRVNMVSEMHVTTMKSLTALEASVRIGKLLCEKCIYDDENVDLYPSIQSFLYHLSRENNRMIYDYLHVHYRVKSIMKNLLSHPSIKRRIIALIYLCSGKSIFYWFLSSRLAKRLPL